MCKIKFEVTLLSVLFVIILQLSGSENSSPRLIVILRTIAHLLLTLGEVFT